MLRRRLPEHHFEDHPRDVGKLVMGLVATLAALVLGLLIASTKSFYDTQTAELQSLSVKIVGLDRVLGEYGTAAGPARAELRRVVEEGYRRLAGTPDAASIHLARGEAAPAIIAMRQLVRALPAETDAQRQLRGSAVQLAGEIVDTRLLMSEQVNASLNWPFVLVLVFWISVLFLGFGLYTPANATVVAALLMGAVSVASAMFLIDEMSRPYEGLIRVSAAPLQLALMQMGQ
ncbi:conserved membrane protein of unknown function [Rhodovastum atsumiense]|uniref:DUF4239 domain-containing protein n=1 Tax=Rhodovastum atsumiense TaxID=504468 RepID=A0A5M6ISJ7_9PROT|nr:hypothetical protein [Rhodovastum atsumiense]KAA5611212.1 hypothetical protein F1189_15705 [Rhodovastum atsumiense]CAH2602478.1 conserved membrane protein of unknown function [Rhodovastum atsumiense]